MRLPPKPPKVENHYEFWSLPPLIPSERCVYWIEQFEAGWRPNRRIRAMGYDSAAQWYGVWIWEYINVITGAQRPVDARPLLPMLL